VFVSRYVLIYLFAIVAANILAARFGPWITIVNAFVFVGLDLTARDALHDAWDNDRLYRKMSLLIVSGSALSYLLNRDAASIAIASAVAFFCAGLVDTIVYRLLSGRDRLVKINASNVFSAATDSVVFPTLAFGQLLPLVILGQFVAKVFGGAVWVFLLDRFVGRTKGKNRETAPAA
jgi:uncharacterized PurR-regulated membrane protein YhhQ (DUF165 family)